MRVLYVADNRNRVNFGCRATSAALSELISEKHEIIGRITGELTLWDDFVYIPFLPKITNQLIYKSPYFVKIVRKFVKHIPFRIRSKFDFLSTDLEKSIKRIMTYSSCNKKYTEINLSNYDYDALIINGEGTMIMSTPSRRDTLYYLLFIYWAKKVNKKVYFLNAMFSDCPKSGRNQELLDFSNKILEMCDLVTMRDPLSYQYVLENMTLKNCRFVPDALFTWNKYVVSDVGLIGNTRCLMPFGFETDSNLKGVDLSGGYLCISGSSSAAWDQEAAKTAYKELIISIKERLSLPLILLEVCSGDRFLKEVAETTGCIYVPAEIPIVIGLNLLAHAKLYISGRYHPSIMASLGGVPCVFLSSNSHKNIGLQEMLEYDIVKEFSACPSQAEILDICNIIMRYNTSDIGSNEKINSVVKNLSNSARSIMDYIN